MQLNSITVTTPPRAAGTLVLVRDGPTGLEVFLVKRHSASDVLGGAHVFPGGKVDAADASPTLHALLDQPMGRLRDALNEPQLNLPDAAALYIAAVREAFEECGVLFAGSVNTTGVARLAPGAPFGDQLAAAGLQLRTRDIVPWSRWITPLVPSVTTKRFDTRFFVAALPEGQTAVHDNHEATESLWAAPRTALEMYWDGHMALAPPQIMSLAHLARYATAAQVFQAAAEQPPPVIFPQPHDMDGCRVVCYPGDPGHSLPQRALPGPTRLIFRNKRFEPPGGFESLFN